MQNHRSIYHIAYHRTFDVTHLDIESVKPEMAALPITETGYLAHFTSAEKVNSYGGPAEFVLAWLGSLQARMEAKGGGATRPLTLF